MSPSWTRRFEDIDTRYLAYKVFGHFNGDLYIWDHGTAIAWGRMLKSTDALSWSTAFTTDPAVWGNAFADDASGMVVYRAPGAARESLFWNKYEASNDFPHVLEWDEFSLTGHLSSMSQGNYLAYGFVTWARRMWMVSDVTPIFSNRRVVYHYDGSTWTPVTDYDGASYLTYNRTDARSPIQQMKHRTTRLFVFNDELYLIAARHQGGGAVGMWGWEVWKYNAEEDDQFNKVFDSIGTHDDNCVPAAVLDQDGVCQLVVSEIAFNGNPTRICRYYRSEDMVNWTEVTDFPIFKDEFDDAERNSQWTDSPGNGTITEAGDLLTIAFGPGVNAEFSLGNAPLAMMTPGENEIIIETKLDSYTVNDDTATGIYITDTIAPGSGISFTRFRNEPTRNGIMVWDVGVGELAYVAVTTLPIWLRIRISGSGAGSAMTFEYSTNGYYWIGLLEHADETWITVGLYASNWGAHNAVDADFEHFRVYEAIGYPYGEVEHDGIMWLNCIEVFQQVTWSRYWDSRVGTFVLDNAFTADVDDRGGGLTTFEASPASIILGKYREIYGAPGVVRKQLRRKKQSLPAVEMTFRDRSDNTLEKNYAPIDTRAPDTFYEGRITSLSSLMRAIDDRTGLFKISDLSMTLANNDKEFSKILAHYFAKDELVKLYHMWADEPHAWREHIMTLVVDDYNIRGEEFMLKLKDITQRYFVKKIPESIVTEADYPSIHPDYVGRYMPEVLGNVAWTDAEEKGAVEALYIDRNGPAGPYDYLASRDELNNVITVYSDNEALDSADWAFVAGPPSLLRLDNDQVDAKITFDAEGYKYGIWNDPTNGYVQNPAYILAYFLIVIMGIPMSMIDMTYIDDLATYFEAIGEERSGRLIIQEASDGMEVLREILFSFGMKGFMAKGGKFRAERKDIHNYETDVQVYSQIDMMRHPDRLFNLTKAIDTVKVKYSLIPWANKYVGAQDLHKPNPYRGDHREDDIRRHWEILQV